MCLKILDFPTKKMMMEIEVNKISDLTNEWPERSGKYTNYYFFENMNQSGLYINKSSTDHSYHRIWPNGYFYFMQFHWML